MGDELFYGSTLQKDKYFHDRLKLNVLGNTTALLAKTKFNDLQVMKTRINGHDKVLDILDGNLQNVLTVMNGKF